MKYTLSEAASVVFLADAGFIVYLVVLIVVSFLSPEMPCMEEFQDNLSNSLDYRLKMELPWLIFLMGCKVLLVVRPSSLNSPAFAAGCPD